MDYGENPYLIYFYRDTANNHIHMVSIRVNTEGVKIDHNFENSTFEFWAKYFKCFEYLINECALHTLCAACADNIEGQVFIPCPIVLALK